MFMKFKLYKYKIKIQKNNNKKILPSINNNIIIKYNNLILYGYVIKNLYNNSASLIKLYSHPDYIDDSLIKSSKYNKGYFLLLSHHKWFFNKNNILIEMTNFSS